MASASGVRWKRGPCPRPLSSRRARPSWSGFPRCCTRGAATFAQLEPLALIQRVHQAGGLVGALQIGGAFGREEAQVMKTFNAWRAFTIATGRLPADGETP